MTDTATDVTTDTAPDARTSSTWRPRWWPAPSALRSDLAWRKLTIRALVAYLLSRLCVIAGAAVVAAQRVVEDRSKGIARPSNAVSKIVDVLTSWDGKWYLAIVRDSYPSHVPPHVTFDDYQARVAFFPL